MAISRSKNSQNWRRQLQSLRRSSSPLLYLPRSLARCARVCSADDNDDAAVARRRTTERRRKTGGGGGGQKEENAEGKSAGIFLGSL
jgi:hypothetical protein